MPEAGINGVPEEVQGVVHTEAGPIPITDFAEFFHLFRCVYAAAFESLVATGGIRGDDFNDMSTRLTQLTSGYLRRLSKAEIDRLGTRPLPVVGSQNLGTPRD